MKKLSLSALAVLAIIVAISSAFTSNNASVIGTNEFLSIDPAQSIQLTNWEGSATMPINDVTKYRTTSGEANVYTQAQVDNVVNGGDVQVCNGSTYVCSVKFSGVDADNSTQVDATELDNYLSGLASPYIHPSTIFYKN